MNQPNNDKNVKISSLRETIREIKISNYIWPSISNSFDHVILSERLKIVNVISADHIKCICKSDDWKPENDQKPFHVFDNLDDHGNQYRRLKEHSSKIKHSKP